MITPGAHYIQTNDDQQVGIEVKGTSIFDEPPKYHNTENLKRKLYQHATSYYFSIIFHIKIANFRALFGRHHSIQFTNNSS